MLTTDHRKEKVLFVLNPEAGPGIQQDLEDEIKQLAARQPFEYRIHKTRGDHDAARLRKALDEFNPAIAVAAGGDGTVNLVACQILDRETRLGIIPLGSSNGLAYQLNIPDQPASALKNIFSGEIKSIDAIQFDGEHICLHLSDLGMNARVIKRYENEGVRGLYGYARQYFKELGKTIKFRCSVHTGDQHITATVVMVVLANASFYGTGANINPEGRPDDGRFEVILVQSYPFWFLLYMLSTFFIRKNRILFCWI